MPDPHRTEDPASREMLILTATEAEQGFQGLVTNLPHKYIAGFNGLVPFGKDLHFHRSERKIRDTTCKKALLGYSLLSPQNTDSDFEI